VAVESIRPAGKGRIRPGRPGPSGPGRSATQMETDLRGLVATIQNLWLHRLLDAMIGPDATTWLEYRDAPRPKRYHQAYRHGLLEHSLSVARP